MVKKDIIYLEKNLAKFIVVVIVVVVVLNAN